jgi:hypothetical protein
MHVGQAEVATSVAVGQSFVVVAEQPQDRGVQVMEVDSNFNRLESEFVRRADRLISSNDVINGIFVLQSGKPWHGLTPATGAQPTGLQMFPIPSIRQTQIPSLTPAKASPPPAQILT